MGVASRDYMRDRPGGSGFWGWGDFALAPVCKYLLIANVVVFLLQIFITRAPRREDLPPYFRDHVAHRGESEEPADPDAELPWDPSSMFRVSVVQQWFQLDTAKVLHGQVWRLVTCAFCHDRLGVWHLVFNMLFLYWFGHTLEAMYGSREFLLFYLTAAVVASLCFVGLDLVTGESTPAIGASGAVMAVVMLYAIHYPRQRILIGFFIPVEIRWLVALYVIFDLHPVLLALAGTRMPTGVAHSAHLGGLAFGFIYWRQGLRLENYWDRLPRLRWDRLIGPRRHIRLFKPSNERDSRELDAKLDQVLQKILEQGEANLSEANLSEEDREILRTASQRYRNRNKSNV